MTTKGVFNDLALSLAGLRCAFTRLHRTAMLPGTSPEQRRVMDRELAHLRDAIARLESMRAEVMERV